MKFLVDFAQIGTPGLNGIQNLKKNDRLYIFYNESSRISFDIHRVLEKTECRKLYQKIDTDSGNALNIMLSTLFGNMVAEDKTSTYAIISKSSDYSVLINYWTEKGISIGVYKNVKEALEANRKPADSSPAEAKPVTQSETKKEEKNLADEISNLMNMRN